MAKKDDPGELVQVGPGRYAADLVPLLVGVDTLTTHPENPNVGDIDGIAASLEKFGQDRAILVQASTGHIVAGNHTYLTACKLGWGDVAAVRRSMSDAEARARMLADNALAHRGHLDSRRLADALEKARADFGDELEAWTAYSSTDLDNLLSELEPHVEPEPDDRGGLLGIADVSVGEPQHTPERDEVWELDHPAGGHPHLLVCSDLFTGHAVWSPWLGRVVTASERPVAFVPYPTPHLPFADGAMNTTLVMVCDELYLAGKLLDAWRAARGENTMRKVATS